MLSDDDRQRVYTVVRAMLAMQRRAWEQGVAGQALLELGESDLVVLLAKDAVVNQAEDGRLGLNGDLVPVADPAANGEPVLFAARVTGDPDLAEAARRMAAYLLEQAPRGADGTIYHNLGASRHWIDSLSMSPPFLAVAGYPAEAVRQVEGLRRALWNPEACLFRHIWDEAAQRFERPAHWSGGNGWAAAGLARVIAALPASMADDQRRLACYLREMLDGCLVWLRPDGLFHDVLDDPATFVETNAGQMLASAIYRSVAGGWLDHRYLAAAERMRQASVAKVDRFGIVHGACSTPRFDRPGTSVEAQAFHILMEVTRAAVN
jgi:rhamnogalacturonyl hydrolase YesR